MSMETWAEPTNLTTVTDLVLGHMEPRPMRVHLRRRSERTFKPGIITFRQRRERNLAGPGQLVHVRLQLSPSNLSPSLLPAPVQSER